LITDNTRYCLVRLVLRKPNQWHATSTLQSFEKEVGEEGLLSSIADLCQPISFPMESSEPNDPLVEHEEVEDHKSVDGGFFLPTYAYNAEAGPSRLTVDPVKAVLESNPGEMNLGFFCEDENNMTLEDILGRLNKDQLLKLVKLTRCKLPSRPKV
jgi:Fanconi-associated nuclease 1